MSDHRKGELRDGSRIEDGEVYPRVLRIGCPACGPNRPPSPVHGPGCEQCEGYGWVWQVPNSLSEVDVERQIHEQMGIAPRDQQGASYRPGEM